MAKRPYHHGNLRAELIESSFDLLAREGLSGFSVAHVARALGVSTASPYRHFADRDHLLAAVAAQAAVELAERIRSDVDSAGPDPRERFAVTAGTYVRYVAQRGAGYPVIFATSLTRLDDPDLAQAGRVLMSVLLQLAQETGVAPTPDRALLLLERHGVIAQGYLTLHREGFLTLGDVSLDGIAERAIQATRELVRSFDDS
jgi:AcrR family transcriptional regulator